MSEHKYESFVQKDSAIIEGIDVSGQWNKMYEPREITNYDITNLDKVTELEGGESMGWCYQCAQCIGVCPMDHVGSYGPRKIFRKLQTGVNLFEHPDLWLCTSCSNCLRVCPKEVDMMKIMPAVREQVVLNGSLPDEMQEMLQNVAEYGNPMGESPRKRVKWARKFDEPIRDLSKEEEPGPVDILWYVSDYFSYHNRGNDAAKALARVFNRLDVDFGILGKDERSDGDSQRLVGETGLFQELAEHNDEQFQKYTYNRLVVSDPHSFNAFKNFYPQVTGNEYPVQHYTQYLAEKTNELKTLLKRPFDKRVTFHDPCYLGRHNGEYTAPRTLINLIPGVQFIEMYRTKEQSYCCGGGGGGMWLDGFVSDHTNERLSENRVKEAVEVGAEVLVVCCPYEVSRFEDAVKSTNNDDKLQVLDIVEIMDYCMGNGDPEA